MNNDEKVKILKDYMMDLDYWNTVNEDVAALVKQVDSVADKFARFYLYINTLAINNAVAGKHDHRLQEVLDKSDILPELQEMAEKISETVKLVSGRMKYMESQIAEIKQDGSD